MSKIYVSKRDLKIGFIPQLVIQFHGVKIGDTKFGYLSTFVDINNICALLKM